MRSLGGDQTGPVAPPFKCVSCLALPPCRSDSQSCPPAMYATSCPLGDQRASVAATPEDGKASGLPPAVEMSQLSAERLFAVTSVVRTVYRTLAPSGDGCGSLTVRTAAKSSKVIVRFSCAPAAVVTAN